MNSIAVFIFYNKATGWQKIFNFSEKFRHLKVITYDGETMISHALNASGMHTEIIRNKNVTKLVSLLKRIPEVSAVVVASIEKRAAHVWKPLLFRSCSEHVRLITGIDTGWTLNPRHFYRKLLSKKRNYKILINWRQEHGQQ
jgi:hypothetical protein